MKMFWISLETIWKLQFNNIMNITREEVKQFLPIDNPELHRIKQNVEEDATHFDEEISERVVDVCIIDTGLDRHKEALRSLKFLDGSPFGKVHYQ